jgi:hypothetical protein
MAKVRVAMAVLFAAILIGGLALGALTISRSIRGPDPESIASASLQSVREQARLTAFAARFVAAVTSSQERFGLTAQKTLIMPGMVRYEIDLAKIGDGDLEWDEAYKRLTVTIPAIEVSRPEIQLSELQEYDSGGLLMRFTNAEERLDAANRRRAEEELARQARQALPLRLARDAARHAIERSFAMPLKAAGIDAQVSVRFADEPDGAPSYLDRSRRIEDVLGERERSSATGR